MRVFISRRTRKKLEGLISVILILLSIFHIFSFTQIVNATEFEDGIFSSENPFIQIEFIENPLFQNTEIFIQNGKIISPEALIGAQFVLFGKLTIKALESKNVDTEIPRNRTLIKETIDHNPGITLREIQRKTGLALGVLQYHLSSLEKNGIEAFKLGRCKHFFLKRYDFSDQEKMWYAVNQNKKVETILQFLKSNENHCFQKDIVNTTEISKVMVSYYIKQLEQYGIINRNYKRLYIVEDYLHITNRFSDFKNN